MTRTNSICFGLLGALLLLGGCSAGIRSAFRLTDASFQPTPAAAEPRVYLYRDEIPPEAFRSVGIIEVTVPASDGIHKAIQAAAAKGKEVGCWALIEHSVFESLPPRAPRRSPQSRGFYRPGALLAHGGSHGDSSESAMVPVRPPLATQFDCVVLDELEPGASTT